MYEFLDTPQPHIPFDAQFVCISACNETASVSISGDALFGKTILGRLLLAACNLQPGQTVEEHNVQQWNTLHDARERKRFTYENLGGVRISALEPHGPQALAEDDPYYQTLRADGLLKPDGTPIAAFCHGRLAFVAGYPWHRLASCLDRTLWAWINPTGMLEIHGTPFALRSPDGCFGLGPHRDGYRQVTSLSAALYAHGASTPVSAADLVETGVRTGWSAKCEPGCPVRPGVIDGNPLIIAHNWNGLARLVQLCDRVLRQDVNGQASQAFGKQIRFRFRLAALDSAPVVACTSTSIELCASHDTLRQFRNAMVGSYGYNREISCGDLTVTAVPPLDPFRGGTSTTILS